MRRFGLLLVTLAALPAGQATAVPVPNSPTLSIIVPRGGRRGTEVELRMYGRNLSNINGILLRRKGIEVLEVKPGTRNNRNMAIAKIRIAGDCPLGEHAFRVRTDVGLSNLRTFWVGELPEVREDERKSNDSRTAAQAIPVGVTVNGRITSEDVDWYAIDVKKPGRINIEVQGVRLGVREFDPFLAVYDANGKELAAVDDTAFGRMDPLASIDVAKPGKYFLELREAAYGGNNSQLYRMHVGRFPRPVAFVPAGGRPGETIDVRLLGDGQPRRVKITLPKGKRTAEYFPTGPGGTAPTPLVLSVRDVPNFIEPDSGMTKPMSFEVPGAINGVIDKPGQVDRWRWTAKRGDRLTVLVLARRLRSPIDPVLSIRQLGNVKGRRFTKYVDDTGGSPDGYTTFTAPAAGEYEVAIFDQLRRGGPLYFYRVELTRASGEVQTRVVVAGRNEDHAVAVPEGGRMATRVAASGLPLGSRLEIVGLPEGVTATSGVLQRGSGFIPVLFEAKPGAKLAGSLCTVDAFRPKSKTPVPAHFRMSVPLVRVRNNQTYLANLEEWLPVAVAKPRPFEIELVPPKVPVIRGAPLRLEVHVKRKKGFKNPVRVRLLYNPPGIGAGQVNITGDKGYLPINASGSAPISKWKVAVVGRVYARGSFTEASSKLVDLEIQAPWVTARLGRARAEQGQKTEMTVTLTKKRSFKGKVKAELLNLPTGAKTVFPEIDENTKSIKFPITLAKNARPGRHRSVYLRLRMPGDHGGEVWHYFRGGELRIDKPLPKKRVTKKSGKKPASKLANGKGSVKKPKTE